jgi:hypothetical protein
MNSPKTDRLAEVASTILALCVGSGLTIVSLALMQKYLNNIETDFCKNYKVSRLLIESHSVVGPVKQCFPAPMQN